MNKQQEPRLRFKGFTEVWQEKVLGEFVKSLDAGFLLIQKIYCQIQMSFLF